MNDETKCAAARNHTPMPEGYLDRAALAEKKLKTHEQVQCPTCGLWAIWVKREGER